MKKLLSRATRCPECGERACSLVKRFVHSGAGRTTYCAQCGCPCRTPAAVFIAAVMGGAWIQYLAVGLFGWNDRPDSIDPRAWESWALPFLIGAAVLHVLFLWLAPFRPCAGEAKRIRARADVKKTIPCSAGRVFRAASNYYGNAYGFELEGRDEEQRILWVRQEKVRYLVEDHEDKWECFCLSFTEAGPDRCEVRVSLGDEESGDYNQRQAVKLNEIGQKLESLLHHG